MRTRRTKVSLDPCPPAVLHFSAPFTIPLSPECISRGPPFLPCQWNCSEDLWRHCQSQWSSQPSAYSTGQYHLMCWSLSPFGNTSSSGLSSFLFLPPWWSFPFPFWCLLISWPLNVGVPRANSYTSCPSTLILPLTSHSPVPLNTIY